MTVSDTTTDAVAAISAGRQLPAHLAGDHRALLGLLGPGEHLYAVTLIRRSFAEFLPVGVVHLCEPGRHALLWQRHRGLGMEAWFWVYAVDMVTHQQVTTSSSCFR